MLHSRENTLHLTQLSMVPRLSNFLLPLKDYLGQNMPMVSIVYAATPSWGLKMVK